MAVDSRPRRNHGAVSKSPSGQQQEKSIPVIPAPKTAPVKVKTTRPVTRAKSAQAPPQAAQPTREPPQSWGKHVGCTSCSSGHWGVGGGAGLLLVRRDHSLLDAPATHVVLQHRSDLVHMGNTWSIPGGALDYGETPIQAALREGREETNLPDDCTEGDNPLIIVREEIALLQHPNWKYTTVIADVMRDFEPKLPIGGASWESRAVEWVAIDEVGDGTRKLHPAFLDAWSTLYAMVTRRDRTFTRHEDTDGETHVESSVDELTA